MTLLSALLPLIGASVAPVSTAPPATAPIRLWMNNDGKFREGDYARIQVDADADGYLLVLQYDTFGRLRVLFPLDPRDDNRVIRGRRYEVRDDGGRFAFRADGDGPGLIYSAIAPDPWRFEEILTDGRWDVDRLTINRDAEDPEPAITELVQRLAGPGGFDYDLLDYRVYGAATSNSTTYVYGRDYVYGYEPYRHCDYYWSYGGCRSFRFGLYYGYDPFSYGYYPYRSYYYPYYSPYYYPRGSITIRPRTPTAIVSGRPRAYNVTPVRPRGTVTSRPIDWGRNREFNTARPTRPSGWNAPAARPARPPSERREFRGETRDRGNGRAMPSGNRDRARDNPPARARDNPPARSEPRARPDGNRGNSGREARGNSNGGGRSSPPPRPSRPRRP
jgi:hypothetical protein